jgi:phosphoribosylamine--glycine ligase
VAFPVFPSETVDPEQSTVDAVPMTILVVGGGAREHALVWALGRGGHRIVAAPGNPGIARLAECVPVKADDLEGQVRLAEERGVEVVVVGPEVPLCGGLADRLASAGIACFGPVAAGARLEGSKIYAKRFFARYGIPTAEFAVCGSLAEAEEAIARLGGAVVVKADGLAAGKGVMVCADPGQARAAAHALLSDGALGEAGRRIVVERRLAGREASVFAITDGNRLAILTAAEDHKALLDGDRGPNTGGMGAVSPAPAVDAAMVERVRRTVLEPTLAGLRTEGIAYRGVLFAGLMIGPDGSPQILEYNCRFGDPEAEVILSRWEAPELGGFLLAAAVGRLSEEAPRFSSRAAVCVIMASAGYPGPPRVGDRIEGLAEAERLGDVVVFHAGTRADGDDVVTAGGRVLAVTALGDDVPAARTRAYRAVDAISFAGAQVRRDIGRRGER